MSASLLSHKGKHGPMLLINKNNIPDGVRDYLKMVKPTTVSPQNKLFNHGWVIGPTENIDEATQGELDGLLSNEE